MTSGGQDRGTTAASGGVDVDPADDPATPDADEDPSDAPDDDAVWRDWTREDLQRSALGGLAAYLATYALLYLWFLSEGRMSGAFTDWRWVGWILYSGQFVPLDVSAGSASASAATAVETGLGDATNVVPALLLSVAVALVAGFLLARAREPADPDAAVVTGASLAVGYLPPAVLGVVVFAGTLPNGVHVRPNPLVAPIVTGVVFPAVVGAGGGLAFVAWRQRTREETDEPVDDAPGGPTDDPHGEPVEDAPDAESPGPRR